jgi:hypothetical protein
LSILVLACQDAFAHLALWYSKDVQALACVENFKTFGDMQRHELNQACARR